MNELWRNFLYALRSSTRRGHRLIAAMIALIVALGIGTATSVFSVVDALLIRGLPFPAAGDLVNVELATAHRRSLFGHVADVALYNAWRREAADAIELAGFHGELAVLTGHGPARTLQVVGITSNMIALLGVHALQGRGFVSTDDVRGAAPSAILSHGLWNQLFGGDSTAIGRRLTLNGRDYRIIGMMPRGFHIPLSIPESRQRDPELWVPLGVMQELLSLPAGPTEPAVPVEIIGRVRPGTSLASIEGKLDRIAKEVIVSRTGLRETGGDPGDVTQVNGLRDVNARSVRTPLLLVSGAVGLLLLLTCLNVANLLMARTISRDREIAVRVAVGASRSRLALQLITEGVAISLFGGLLGVGLAFLAMPGLVNLGALYLPDVDAIDVNLRVLLFALGVTAASGLAVGAWPAATALNRSPMEAMTSRTRAGRRAIRRGMRALVMLEIAFAIVLLTTMGLLGRSFVRLAQTARGYDVRNVIVAGFILPERVYSTAEARRTFTFRLLNELRREPAIALPAVSSGVPIVGGTSGMAWDGDGPSNGKGARAAIWNVAGDYFRSLGIPIIRGSELDFTVNPNGVAIDAAAARVLFGTENVLGRRIVWGRTKNEGVVNAVVGDIQDLSVNVGANSKYRTVNPHIYVPAASGVSSVVRISARTRGDAARALNILRETIATIDRDLPVDANTMAELVRTQLARERFLVVIVALFAALAVVLGSAGIFAVMAHSTAQRTHEIGVRLALGARPTGIVLLILRDGLALTGVGTTIGILGTFAMSGILHNVLFEISPFDSTTLIGVVVVTAAVSLLASAMPAIRASRVNATMTLLSER